jgi:glycyl-tRNA synthetase beta chain
MTDFLLELRCEEVPARMQAGARRDLEKLFREHMRIAGITLGEITVWSTPRRLALIAKSLPDTTAAVSEELKGPKLGAPPQALEGFLRKTGLIQDQLTERDGVYFAISEKPGRATADVLAEAIPAIIRAFPWPKSQRWGAASISTESLRWVRPLSGIVAIFGQDLVECAVGDVRSGFATKGHRFHAPGEITIGGASDYQDKLRACHVIVDHTEREALICTKASAAATAAGLVLVEDEGLVIENAGLTEWPVPLLGRFDAEYLEVPPEVIQLTARTNQKYFVCEQHGKLANAFVCTANIEAADGGAEIVSGNRKVLAARLSDARFFWQQDRKKTLAQHAEGLARITFHEKLGTVADKVERVAKLARWLVEEGIVKSSPLQGRGLGEGAVAYAQRQDDSPHPNPSPEEEGLSRAALADQTELAARLCKADLVTEMVGEFPELQGLMGGYYARAEGLDNAVADAIRDHYKPVGQGDDVPTAPVTVAVSLADKLDTLAGFFEIEEFPTGSKDPYALRRSAMGVMQLVRERGLELHIGMALELGWLGHSSTATLSDADKVRRKVISTVPFFVLDRLEVLLREIGVRHDFVRSSRRWQNAGDGRIDRVEKRARALQSLVGTQEGVNLLAGYKRAANILKKEQFESGEFALSYTPEPAEKALIEALESAGPQAAAAVAREDFSEAMAALASLRAPIDAFFDSVTVNDADPQKRAARLSLLAQFRDAVHSVADFSKIEG